MANNEKKLVGGTEEEILAALISRSPFWRMNGIVEAVKNKSKGPAIIMQIKKLANDNEGVFSIRPGGYVVSDFAIAALDLLNVEKYDSGEQKNGIGNYKERINDLIKSKFEF